MAEDQEAESRRKPVSQLILVTSALFHFLLPPGPQGFADAHSCGGDGGHLLHSVHQFSATHFWKHPHRHMEKQCSIKYLGILWISQIDT